MNSLSPKMSARDFENGYWYAVQLKEFGDRLGIPGAGKLRKDQLEKAILAVLSKGKAELPKLVNKRGPKDLERGLSLKLPIVHYTSNRETKDFIIEQAQRMAPGLREKSGCWYRLNRWREEQILSGKRLTYGDLIKHYIRLNRMERFDRIEYKCYINFLSDYFAAQKGATREEAVTAWEELKKLDVPKDYPSWARASKR